MLSKRAAEEMGAAKVLRYYGLQKYATDPAAQPAPAAQPSFLGRTFNTLRQAAGQGLESAGRVYGRAIPGAPATPEGGPARLGLGGALRVGARQFGRAGGYGAAAKLVGTGLAGLGGLYAAGRAIGGGIGDSRRY